MYADIELKFHSIINFERRIENITVGVMFSAAAITNLTVSAPKVNPGETTVFTPSIVTGEKHLQNTDCNTGAYSYTCSHLHPF